MKLEIMRSISVVISQLTQLEETPNRTGAIKLSILKIDTKIVRSSVSATEVTKERIGDSNKKKTLRNTK